MSNEEYIQLPSGLVVPRTAFPTDLDVGPTQAPSSFDQTAIRPMAEHLGLRPMSLREIRDLASRVPFEPAFVAYSRIAARIWHIPTDGQAQLEVVREVFGEGRLLDNYRNFLRRFTNGVPLTEQQLFIAQRLLIEHAQDAPLDIELTQDQVEDIGLLLLHSHDVADADTAKISAGNPSAIDMLAFLVQAGAYSQRPSPVNAFSRSYVLLVEYARKHPDARLPLETWAIEDGCGFTLEEQLSIGSGLSSSTHVFDKDPTKHTVLLQGPFLAKSRLADKEDRMIELFTADRGEYADAFRETEDPDSLRNVAWETTPFLQKPFLRLQDGRVVLVSPRAITSWLSDGPYYRFLDGAQHRSTKRDDLSRLFTSYYGGLVEAYALDLMRSVYPAPSTCRVFRERTYGKGAGKKTPDIVIDCGERIVVFEIRSGNLTRRLRVAGEPKALGDDLDRLVFQKVRQLGARIADLVAGTAQVEDVDFAGASEIWPVVVTADVTLVEPLYNWIERERTQALTTGAAQSVVLLDLEDLEFLAGLIEQGRNLPGLLRDRDGTNYRALEFGRYAIDHLGVDNRLRAKFTEDAWARAGDMMVRTLGFSEEAQLSIQDTREDQDGSQG